MATTTAFRHVKTTILTESYSNSGLTGECLHVTVMHDESTMSSSFRTFAKLMPIRFCQVAVAVHGQAALDLGDRIVAHSPTRDSWLVRWLDLRKPDTHEPS